MYWYLLGGIPVQKNPISLGFRQCVCVFTWWVSEIHASMLTKKCVIADGAWFSKCVELVQPFSGDVKLQQAGLLHIGQGHDFLPLPHWLLTALPAQIHEKHSQRLQAKKSTLITIGVAFDCSPIKQHIGFCVLHNCLMDLCDILVIKLIPLTVDDILTVSNVMSTCISIKVHEKIIKSHACSYLQEEKESYFLQCHGDKWLTAGHMWWLEKDCPWPGKAAC